MALPNQSISSLIAGLDSEVGRTLWRGNQMGSAPAKTLSSGHAVLDAELPGGGWPKSTLTEMLLQQHGIGELRLLSPALAAIGKTRRIALLSPPLMPQIAAWSAAHIDPQQLLMLKSTRTADTLWAAEQILRNGSCGAALLWQQDVRPEALRRLQLAAQSSETMFWLVRPLTAQENPSPAPLRLALTPAIDGVNVHVAKRRGPVHEGAVYVQLANRSPVAADFDLHDRELIHPAQPLDVPAPPRLRRVV
jgi:protein ImuA